MTGTGQLEQVRDRVAVVTLDPPDKRNAYTEHMRDEMVSVFDLIDADDDVRVVVVTGAGRGFWPATPPAWASCSPAAA